eukprot:gene4874-8468_t
MFKTFASKSKVAKLFVRNESSVNRDKVLAFSRRGKLKYLSDYEILSHSEYPAEYPSTEIPVPESEIKSRKGRRALGWMYSQFKELYNLHRNVVWFDKREVSLTSGNFIAPNATVIGNVLLNNFSSIWYGAVLKGDLSKITIGGYTNVQDGAVITTDDKVTIGNFDPEVVIGNYTTIGHGARLHACRVGHQCLIGNGATILEGAVVEDGAQVGAGAVVPPGRRIPAGEVWVGSPAKFLRKVEPFEIDSMESVTEKYYDLSKSHDMEFTTNGTAHKEVRKIVEKLEKVLPEETNIPVEHWNQWEKMGEEATLPFWEGRDQNKAVDDLIKESK